MRKVRATILTISPLLAYSLFVPQVFAQPVPPGTDLSPCPHTNNGQGFDKLCSLTFNGSFIGNLIIIIFILAILLALAYLIWGGVRWILSGGDKGKVDEARKTVIAALIGLVIVFLCFFIIQFVLSLFGLGFSNLKIPSLTG